MELPMAGATALRDSPQARCTTQDATITQLNRFREEAVRGSSADLGAEKLTPNVVESLGEGRLEFSVGALGDLLVLVFEPPRDAEQRLQLEVAADAAQARVRVQVLPDLPHLGWFRQTDSILEMVVEARWREIRGCDEGAPGVRDAHLGVESREGHELGAALPMDLNRSSATRPSACTFRPTELVWKGSLRSPNWRVVAARR